MKLKPYSFREVILLLSKLGVRIIRQKGSHIILKGIHNGIQRTVVVPRHKEIAIGTLKGILFQAGITIEEFVSLTEKN